MMFKARHLTFSALLVSWLLVSSCSPPETGEEITPDFDQRATQIAQTVVAELTRIADQASPTPSPQTPSPTFIPPTMTPSATATATQAPTPTPSPTPIPCDWAWFVTDVTVEDGTTMIPGETFVKTWRLENIGSCTWTPAYDLVFVDGDRMDAEPIVPIPGNVLPGDTVDIAVKMVAPFATEKFRGYWQLRNANGVLFGVGDNADDRFWVDIQVVNPPSREVYELIYDFANNVCEAEWESDIGILPCPGVPDEPDGFVSLLRNPALENRQEDELAIWAHPNRSNKGWIVGTYPAVRIQEGYHFFAWIGCLDDSPGCKVNFQLDYQRASGGPVRNLGIWVEAYDRKVTVIDLDLSDLAGTKVKFILSVSVANDLPDQANAFWFVPRVDKLGRIN